MPENENRNIDYLLTYCSGCPELYNKVSSFIWAEFGIQSAEVSLLCTYVLSELSKEVTHEESTN